MVVIQVDPCFRSNHIGYVTSKTLRTLKILNNQWISIAISKGGGDKEPLNNVRKHFERAIDKQSWYCFNIKTFTELDMTSGLSVGYQDGQIYISSSDMFNMVRRPKTFKELLNRPVDIDYENLMELSYMKDKYIAKSATISMTSCPRNQIHTDVVDELLNEYFETPRLLGENEVFSIELGSHLCSDHNRPSHVWFRVDKLVSKDTSHVHRNAARLVSHDTELVLGKLTNGFVPYCACMVKSKPVLYELFTSKFLHSAFTTYFSTLDKCYGILQSKAATSNATILVEAPTGFGKGLVVQAFCFDQGLHFMEENCLDIVSDSFAVTERKIKNIIQTAREKVPCLLYLKNIQSLCKDKEGHREERRIVNFFSSTIQNLEIHPEFPLMIVSSTTSTNDMSSRFFSQFMYHVSLEIPAEDERSAMINTLFNSNVDEIIGVSKKTNGFILSDFIALFKKLNNKYHGKIPLTQPGKLSGDFETDLQEVVDSVRTEKSGTLTNVKVEKVTWSDVGGLEDAKKDIFDTIELPMKFPHLFQNNMRRSGLLFYGPPGCGKTLLAKVIANEFSLNFYSVKGPELINMYVGQSEENVRETFKTARRMAPCVVFFDEIDSLAPNRGRSGDSGGVMDRIVSQLLSELDGMHDNTDVFIIAATNRPDLLDPALLRPGRLDKLIYVGVPEGRLERLKLLDAVTKKLDLASDVCLEDIVDEIPNNLTGADFKALASGAMMCAIKRRIYQHEVLKQPLHKSTVLVSAVDFREAMAKCEPSVSVQELERYKSIRNEMKSRK